jgi:tRNA uridine 5-carbamoylmethylation protein Kti12
MKNTLVVNFFAGPGAGKSTAAAHLFYLLKTHGVDCEMAREYAKDLVWEEQHYNLSHGHYVTAVQIHRIELLLGKVDVIITDSPILLALPYIKDLDPSFEQYAYHRHVAMNNMNIFISRAKKYNPNGRNETLDEAILKDAQIKNILDGNTGPEFEYKEIIPSAKTITQLGLDVVERM